MPSGKKKLEKCDNILKNNWKNVIFNLNPIGKM